MLRPRDSRSSTLSPKAVPVVVVGMTAGEDVEVRVVQVAEEDRADRAAEEDPVDRADRADRVDVVVPETKQIDQ